MFIDTTLFNDEFEMLDIRIKLSESYVDRWVVCEGNRTMSGKSKSYNLSDNIDRYKHLGDRLRVIKLDIPDWWTNWDIENGQRQALLPGYADCDDQDIIMHSDLDEILDPTQVQKIVDYMDQHNRPVSCSLDMYIYKFDQRLVGRKWGGNVIARKHMFQDPCKLYKGPESGVGHAQKKKRRSNCVSYPDIAGWHWTWINKDEVVKNKIRSCIETQARDVDSMMKDLQDLKMTTINHKCETQYETPNYPDCVNQVIRQYPYWTK